MNVAVYTLTRDRLDYTKYAFQTLAEKAGHSYDHFIIDNGSVDGTVQWLKENEDKFKRIIYNAENLGISKASNQALDAIFGIDKPHEHNHTFYDLIIKFDNDCEVLSENIIGQIVEIYQDQIEKNFAPRYVLSPYVEGLTKQPHRGRFVQLCRRRVGMTGIVGGIFHIVPAEIYANYRYPDNLPKAWGQDDDFCHYVKTHGGEVGYIEGLKVNHYETTTGQAQRYPDYFKHKH